MCVCVCVCVQCHPQRICAWRENSEYYTQASENWSRFSGWCCSFERQLFSSAQRCLYSFLHDSDVLPGTSWHSGHWAIHLFNLTVHQQTFCIFFFYQWQDIWNVLTSHASCICDPTHLFPYCFLKCGATKLIFTLVATKKPYISDNSCYFSVADSGDHSRAQKHNWNRLVVGYVQLLRSTLVITIWYFICRLERTFVSVVIIWIQTRVLKAIFFCS
jgi:hypothetical protein